RDRLEALGFPAMDSPQSLLVNGSAAFTGALEPPKAAQNGGTIGDVGLGGAPLRPSVTEDQLKDSMSISTIRSAILCNQSTSAVLNRHGPRQSEGSCHFGSNRRSNKQEEIAREFDFLARHYVTVI